MVTLDSENEGEPEVKTHSRRSLITHSVVPAKPKRLPI
jgi:hypothetical protein